MLRKIIVIGGGASGMTCAVFAARAGADVLLFEKNEKLGKKLFITGKGRCNFTNLCSVDELIANVVSNSRFLYSAFNAFSSADCVSFFEELGVRTKVERGRRVFPASDHSSDIIRALQKELGRLNVDIRLNSEVRSLIFDGGRVRGVKLKGGSVFFADAVIIATGGLSYPSTGSTGDGYRFAREAQMRLVDARPALVPMEVKEDFIVRLQGLSLKNIKFTVKNGKKTLCSECGELLFTHFGISGPLVLSASSIVGKTLGNKELSAEIDLKPALSIEQLDKRILRDFSEGLNRRFKNSLSALLPAKLIPVIISLSDIPADVPVNNIGKESRRDLARLIKGLSFTVTKLRPYNEAVITQGGVDVKDIDPATMESKTARGLYFAGEVMDVDALTGGYNLQVAWSTAYKAGISAASEEE